MSNTTTNEARAKNKGAVAGASSASPASPASSATTTHDADAHAPTAPAPAVASHGSAPLARSHASQDPAAAALASMEFDENGLPKVAPKGGTKVSFEWHFYNFDKLKQYPIFGYWFDRILQKEQSGAVDPETGEKKDFFVYLVKLAAPSMAWDREKGQAYKVAAGEVLRVPENAGNREMIKAIANPDEVGLWWMKFEGMKQLAGTSKKYVLDFQHHGQIKRDLVEPGGRARVLALLREHRVMMDPTYEEG